MGLLAKAKERHKERISRQFISFYDSVLYLGEPIKDALEFITDNLRNNQTHIRLEHGELYLISVKRYQDDEDERNYFAGDYIEKHLVECINQGFIDETSPIYNLGFAKKSYIEMLISYGIPITEDERINTQSPDLAFDDEYFEIDYYTFEMVVADRDDLRARLEKQQVIIDNPPAENGALNATLEKQLAQAKAKIADLENQLAQAKAALADKPADEVELNPKTKTSATRIMNVLFHKAQLDITAHQGTTNKTIVNLSKSLNATITEKPVIFWIKEVQQLRIDTEKDN